MAREETVCAAYLRGKREAYEECAKFIEENAIVSCRGKRMVEPDFEPDLIRKAYAKALRNLGKEL